MLYDCDLVEERKTYVDSMLHHAEEHMSTQCQYEAEQATCLEGARQKCATERERIEALEVCPFFNWAHRADIDNLTVRTQGEAKDSRLKCSRRSAREHERRLNSNCRMHARQGGMWR